MKLGEVTNYNLKSQTILAEGWQDLNEAQRIYVGKWEKDVWPLVEGLSKLLEAELDKTQIDKIFTNAKQVAIDSGNNKTVLGKAGQVVGDQAKKITDQIKKLADAAQQSGPIKNFDAQFDKMKAQLQTKLKGNPAGQKILSIVDGYKGFATENPAKAAFVIGAMTSVLAFASGGIVSGAAIGFFLKLASNTLKGDKLSTAVGKSVKGAALGAVAGAIGDQIGELLPPEVTNTFINDASGEIDITKLDGMSATSIADLDAESAKELIQTRSAMEELVARGNLDADAEEVLQGQLDQVNDKIREIGDGASINDTVDAMQDEFGIKGTDVTVDKTTTTSTRVDRTDLPGEDGEYGDQDAGANDGGAEDKPQTTTTEVVAELDADKLNSYGVNSADYPDNQWITDNTQKLLDGGMTEEQIEALQKAQGFNRALDQKEFLNTRISASTSIEVGDSLQVDGVPDEIKVGEVFKSTVSKTMPDGTEYGGIVDVSIEGVDSAGNPVYQMKNVFVNTNPFTEELDKALEALPDDVREDLYDQIFKGSVSGSMETAVDDTAANIVKAAAAVALGGALAKSEFVEPKADAKKEESIERHNEMIYEYVEYLEETMNEGPALDKMKAAAMAGVKKAGDLTTKGLTQVGKGMDKAGAAVAGGISKTAGGIKKQAKQLGNKITKEKLMKAWTKAGEPTDVASVVSILQGAGMDDESIGIVGTQTKVKLPIPAGQEGDPEGDPDGTTPAPGAGAPGATGAAEPVDANKDGKDDNTGKPIPKPVDKNKDGKDDNTGKVIQMPGTTRADGVDAKSGMAKGMAGTDKKDPYAIGGAHSGKKAIKPKQMFGKKGKGAASAPTKPANVDIPTLAKQINDAGLQDAIKKQLTAPPKAGGEGDLGTGIGIDIPTLADKISDAGMQDTIKKQLQQPAKQPPAPKQGTKPSYQTGTPDKPATAPAVQGTN